MNVWTHSLGMWRKCALIFCCRPFARKQLEKTWQMKWEWKQWWNKPHSQPCHLGELQYKVWSAMETFALFSSHYFPVFPWPEVSYNPQHRATVGARLVISELFIQPPAHILYPSSSCKVAQSWRQQILILTGSFLSHKKITKGHWRAAANLLAAPRVLSYRMQSSTAIFHSLWTWHPAVVTISPSCC